MIQKKCLLLAVIVWCCTITYGQQVVNTKAVFSDVEQQTEYLSKKVDAIKTKTLEFPRTTVHDSLKLVVSGDWTSGFWAGELWFLYQYTGKAAWKEKAQEATQLMNREQWNRSSHDVGFKIYCSYGNGYRLTKDTAYEHVIIQAAKTLATRFNSKIGCIRSWDFRNSWQYPVIIDNMMNLELLFAATRLSHDSSFYRIAVSHANTTLKNHFRSDYSSYHVVDYDTLTGKPIKKITAQGYADSSAWARGQAWALYGYTMCYRETHNTTYLKQAEHVANFILTNPHIPVDMVPYWDYNVPDPGQEPRDASAAAITASALYELSQYSKQGKAFKKAADEITKSLTDHYRAAINTNEGFILMHSTGHKPAHSEIDVPLIYADYYYLEALLRANTLSHKTSESLSKQ